MNTTTAVASQTVHAQEPVHVRGRAWGMAVWAAGCTVLVACGQHTEKPVPAAPRVTAKPLVPAVGPLPKAMPAAAAVPPPAATQSSASATAVQQPQGQALAVLQMAGPVALIDAQTLQSIVPQRLAGLPRSSLKARNVSDAGVPSASVTARFGAKEQGFQLNLAQSQSFARMALEQLQQQGAPMRTQDRDGYTSSYLQDGRTVGEIVEGGYAHYQITSVNGVYISAESRTMDIQVLKTVVDSLPVDRLLEAR